MKRLTAISLAFILTLAGAMPMLAMGETAGDSGISPLFVQSDESSLKLNSDDLDSWNSSTPLPTSRNAFEIGQKMNFALQAEDDGSVTAQSGTSGERKNPGRALLLSAIFPGAGELYAGSTLKAALFFAIEVGCWYGAISYAQRGNDQTTRFEKFADGRWTEDDYRDIEFQFANDPNAENSFSADFGDDATRDTWNSLSWNEKIRYLPGNFTHELPDERNQQFYENVGKYLTQFGFGWNDGVGDDPETVYKWDGQSRDAASYVIMREDANNLLGLSSTFFSVIMVNHVVSALDAGFTVRNQNRKLMTVEPDVSAIMHNSEPVTVAGLRVRF